MMSQLARAGSDLLQNLIDQIISPKPPTCDAVLGRPKIAVIGAGITGVTAAAHCVGHGFDVRIFEAGGVENLGGIWSVSWPRYSAQLPVLRVLTKRQYQASQRHLNSTDPLGHVPLPPLGEVAARLPRAARDHRAGDKSLERIQLGVSHTLQRRR